MEGLGLFSPNLLEIGMRMRIEQNLVLGIGAEFQRPFGGFKSLSVLLEGDWFVVFDVSGKEDIIVFGSKDLRYFDSQLEAGALCHSADRVSLKIKIRENFLENSLRDFTKFIYARQIFGNRPRAKNELSRETTCDMR
jgi:hypothetical protein